MGKIFIVLYHFQDESDTWEDDDYSSKKVLLNPLLVSKSSNCSREMSIDVPCWWIAIYMFPMKEMLINVVSLDLSFAEPSWFSCSLT